MLNRILDISLRHRLGVLTGAALLCMTGMYLARTMNVDVFPDLTAPTVALMTEAHGMEAQEVERLVTYQIETALNGSPGVRRIRSSSAPGFSIVWAEFDWGTDIYRARQIVSERMTPISASLPAGVEAPTMAPISSIMGEIMLLGLTSDELSPMELRTLADWTVNPRLKSVRGIANVFTIGGDLKQYQVLANPGRLRYYGITLSELTQRVKEASAYATGGFFDQYGNRYMIKGNGLATDIDRLAEGLVKSVNGQAIKIRDVAEVKIGSSDKIGDGSINTEPSVILIITKQPDVNTLALTKEIDAIVADLQSTIPSSVKIQNEIFKQSDFIEASISNLNQTLIEGALFVSLVLFIFLMNWRTTVISLVAIPISLLASIIVLNALGYTINTMSLGGMAIAIGALVDDAIIDVENVYKRLRENASLPSDKRKSIISIVKEASIEIRSSIVIATLIIIVAFIPLFFLGGMEGRLLKPLGIAFITSVMTSLVVAVTITPVLCSYLLNNEKTLQRRVQGTGVEVWLSRHYTSLLSKALNIPKLLIGTTAAMFLAILLLFTQLGRSFLPEFNEGSLVLSVVGPPSMSLEESNKTGRLVEELLLELPEIQVVTRHTGRAKLSEHAQGVNAAEVDAPFILDGKSKEQFFQEVRDKLTMVPGANITVGQPIAHRIDHMLSGTRANIAIKIFGPSLPHLFELGKEVEGIIEPIPGLADVAVDQQVDVPQIRVKPRTQLLAAYGLTIHDLMEQVDIAIAGEKVGEIYEGQQYFDLVVRYRPAERSTIERLPQMLISLPEGKYITLDQVATVSSVSSPGSISREGVQRKIVVAANVQGRDLRGAVKDIQSAIETSLNLPERYRIEYGGQFESESRASELLSITAVLAILVIFILLYFEFRNIKLALVVLLNLPLALMGGILIVYFTSGIISIAATIGFISLFGIATRNGILLVSRYGDLENEGASGLALIKQGALERLNPILMTAFTTGLALIPLAVKGDQAGNEIQSPMAIVILGGLISATLLNLFVIPCVYSLMRQTTAGD
ncbi:MAG: efflux RND transporter permease subunit [Bacteroidota bacterium]